MNKITNNLQHEFTVIVSHFFLLKHDVFIIVDLGSIEIVATIVAALSVTCSLFHLFTALGTVEESGTFLL